MYLYEAGHRYIHLYSIFDATWLLYHCIHGSDTDCDIKKGLDLPNNKT
jgi:hypothetical protein